MSSLAKTFAKTKLGPLPPEPPVYEDVEHEDDSSSASSMSSTGTVIPTSSQRPAPSVRWSDYFSQEFYLERLSPDSSHAKFHVYLTPPNSAKAPLLVLHHGAGSSALSFALFAKELQKQLPDAGILAVEARDHGSVVWGPEGHVDNDLSIDLLSQDMVDMMHLTQARMGWKELPTVVLIGHSLGGAVVTNAAKQGLLGNKLLGYAVLDVVEGSAMEALKHMQAYLANRPKMFPTLDAAIDWHIRSRTLRNPKSARASVPSLLLQTSEGRWAWRTDLSTTEAYWENWFSGMSSKFLGGKGAKLLMLAGTDRLDKELMIGQMQGKFQLQVFPSAGHFLQEDQPERTAEVVVEFVKRNDRSALVLPPKVSDLLAQGKKV
ncbi:protein phosphatase methylesteras-like protein 1 [Lindgomyces ingoldianus]|uniref:Protein phosphatase methylesteras-like protein 1 n=1 Tax=Lindgomyces ingoldianus TaxID=673940 RepID=A0ACB6QMX5_9PLEO|nr:protein phosphatase methylesteras-like protein 1 [Lindgomyces ingoldianus]KAF2468240.1 protein phosphatase methylesteras-like protein 1 [Lindgomyces ingoldianus]